MFIRHFIRLYEKEHGGGPHPISRSQMVKLCCLKWSGNLWEIKNLALRICLADSTDDVIRQSPNLRSAAEQLGISYSSLCRKRAEYRAQAPDKEQP